MVIQASAELSRINEIDKKQKANPKPMFRMAAVLMKRAGLNPVFTVKPKPKAVDRGGRS